MTPIGSKEVGCKICGKTIGQIFIDHIKEHLEDEEASTTSKECYNPLDEVWDNKYDERWDDNEVSHESGFRPNWFQRILAYICLPEEWYREYKENGCISNNREASP